MGIVRSIARREKRTENVVRWACLMSEKSTLVVRIDNNYHGFLDLIITVLAMNLMLYHCTILLSGISVCSTTLWLGHLSKSISEDDIKAEMEFYGEVVNVAVSIHLMPSKEVHLLVF